MRRQESTAWLELGYAGPSPAEWNREAQVARSLDRNEARSKRQAREAAPVRRSAAREWFAKMHAVVEAGGKV